MTVYPVNVPRKHYRGTKSRLRQKARRYNEIAQICEDYLNRRIAERPEEVQQYTYAFMASDLNLTTAQVREVMFGVDAGHNGITVRKLPPQQVLK